MFEAVIPSLKAAVSAADRTDLRDTIASRLSDEYTKAARRTLKDLHKGTGKEPPPFHLQAAWKRKALDQQARAMAKSLADTVAKEQARLEAKGLPAKEVGSKLAEFYRYKTRQLGDIIQAEARMQAEVDQLVHAGIVNPAKDRIMILKGPHTCPLCTMVYEGNPYTVNEATNYGAKLHPNCRDHWEQSWQVDPAVMAVTKQRIRDGSLSAWTGTGRTPGPQSAAKGREITERYSTDWGQQRRKAVRDARRRGVDEATVNATLTRKQRKEREKTVRRQGRKAEEALRDYVKV
jgi:hypothetical protein